MDPYRKRLMIRMCLEGSGRIWGLSIFGGSERNTFLGFGIFLRGLIGPEGEEIWVEPRRIDPYRTWGPIRTPIGPFGALLGPLLGLIFHFGLVKTEELATGGFKLLGLAEKSVA